ncbi:MAG: pitrilysin family protein [Gemmatimonadota bacterium]|nr:pitrilysin family protein [Gemmatimonadota bacterium]
MTRSCRPSLLPAIFAMLLPVLVPAGTPSRAHTQDSVRERIAEMRFPDLRFRRIEPREESVRGVPVYFLEDHELPLVTVYATFEGGVRHFPRDFFAAASAMPGLLRTGGTLGLPPDSVDARIELMALAMSFGQGGGSASSWVNTLSVQVDDAVRLWADMLRSPRFDSTQVELWRGSELERVRRRRDDPASLAFGRFNRIMYGEHPVGWEMGAADLEPADLADERLRYVHAAVVCPENMVLGVAGDISWRRIRALLNEMLAEWPACSGNLQEDPGPEIRPDPGVFVIHREIEQSVVVMAHATSIRQGDNDGYFASRIGNAILGASGLSSRLASELRTREGLAYSASSIWTTSRRDDGLAGALTRTRPETTLAAARLLLAAIDSMRASPPAQAEVTHAVDEVVNGFVFNFRTPFQIIARGMAYRRLDLPPDWLERYVDGIQDVTPARIQRVFRREVDPARMTVLLVGDTTRFDGSASELGPVTVLSHDPVDGGRVIPAEASSPRERPRFPR